MSLSSSAASNLAASQQTEVEESIKRIQTHKGVQGFIITSHDGKNVVDRIGRSTPVFLGTFVRSTIDNSTTMSLTSVIRTLADKAKSCVRDLDPQNDLTFLRVRTKKQEILVAPGKTTRESTHLDANHRACFRKRLSDHCPTSQRTSIE